ncbi:MAG: V-type ATPase 116kDa subunit family protein [Caldisericia bacterium]
MAIVAMKKVTLAVPSRSARAALDLVKKQNLLHFRKVDAGDEVKIADSSENELLLRLDRAKKALENLDGFFPEKLPFISNFSWPRPRLSPEKYLELKNSIDFQEFISSVNEYSQKHNKLKDSISKISNERHLISRYKFLPVPTKIENTENITFILGQVPRRNLAKINALNSENDVAVTVYSSGVVLVSCKHQKCDEVKLELSRNGFESLPIPSSDLTPREQIEQIDSEIEKFKSEQKEILEILKRDFHKHRLALIVNIDNLENDIESERVKNLGLDSLYASVFVGYLPAQKAEGFRNKISENLEKYHLQISDITAEDNPPVELSNNKYSKNFEMLSAMYGLPGYRGIDSTFIISIIFPIFFGFCFGDVLYGLMLIGFSLWFGKIYRYEESAKKFFGTFITCGVYVTIIGALTGAWGGDMVGTIITWEPLVSLRNDLVKIGIDPLIKTIPFFVLTLYIGIGTQFLGILYKAYLQIKNGEWLYAVTDSLGWIIFLSGLTMFAIDFLTPGAASSGFMMTMYVLIVVGAVFLIFSQGKDSKSVGGRIGVGVISLYGVLGGYGTTGFLSDVMSYSRLLALGLTTSIVGQAFNSIAAMMGLEGFGLIFAILILFVGHLFNFFLNIIGSFVHPARLVFLEFYSRFYESGGKKYTPYSEENHTRINVMEESPSRR